MKRGVKNKRSRHRRAKACIGCLRKTGVEALRECELTRPIDLPGKEGFSYRKGIKKFERTGGQGKTSRGGERGVQKI